MRQRTCMEGFFGQFLRESNLHGVKYIGSPDRHPCEKLFWLTAVLASVGLSFYMVAQLYVKYNDNPVIISFSPMAEPISAIPFPAITLCNVNILKTQLVRDVVKFLDFALDDAYAKSEANITVNLKELKKAIYYSEHLAHHCLAAPSFRRLLNETLLDALGESDYVASVQDYISKYVNIETLSSNMSSEVDESYINTNVTERDMLHMCEDMILKCMWAQRFIPCNQLFRRINTQHGGCCVYNMMPKHILKNIPDNETLNEQGDIPINETEAWKDFKVENLILSRENAANVTVPRHQKAGGKPYGLSILINPELGYYSTCNTNDANGFQLIAHSPISFPSIMEYGIAIPPESEVFIDIEPQLTTASEDLKSIGLGKRGCYFPSDEKAKLASYNFYSSSNCLDECIARLTYAKCKCVRFFMPRNSTQSLCGAKKLDCSEQVRKNLTLSAGIGEHCSECKPACTEIKYQMQLSHFPLRDNISTLMYNTSEEENRVAHNYSIVHIFLGTDTLYAKERKRLYDAADLLANAGGLLSLTLGFSIISLIEILYFFTLRAWFQREEDKAAAAAESNEEDFCLRSKREGHSHNCQRVFAVKPRIMDGLNIQDKMTDYYNWAMAAAATNVVNVKSSNQPIIADKPKSFSDKKTSRRRIPAFQLLSRQNNEEITYPYLS